jgi:hypothetical protein
MEETMLIEYTTLALVILLSLILTIYNRRQATALRGMERLVEDFVSMQIRDRRAQTSRQLQIDPLEWVARQVNSYLETPIQVTGVMRVLNDIQAVELRTEDNRRLVVSPSPKKELLNYDRRLRAKGGSSATDRLENFAAKPLLGKSRWGFGIKAIERSLASVSEFFDIEAEYIAERFGTNWGQPTRLWFYVVT